MYHPFSVADTIKTAWGIFRKNFITIIVYSAIASLLMLFMSIVIGLVIPSGDFYTEMLASFILVFIQAYTTLGLYKLIFTLIDSEYYEFEIRQVLPHIRMILSYLAVIFIIGTCVVTYKIFILDHLLPYPLASVAANVLGVIIGLYLILRFMFFNTYVVDDLSGPIESLNQSFSLTKDHMVHVVSILSIIVILIAIPAKVSQYLPPLSVLLLFAYPFVNIILIVTYRKLIYSNQDVDDDVAETL
ncbi:hypothetical protein BDD43_4187 [Mucilaginibacter gracilis]|uniref:Uncharacterized protein n=1 Tax=Mucilaginibacter gracilis TaxID=423350 RepID=A0A495J5S0_9SPHI|nr:hypothetical protein [Mucilaginibacter gracilis]RKR83972.1 hypothetical protein BDD43_4187 [Mucilaginibacter gracilis]